jgi:hypothetical protein
LDLLKLSHFSPQVGTTSILTQMNTVFESDSVGAGGQVLADDAVELVEVAGGGRPEPDQPSLLGNPKGHLRVCRIHVHAHVGRPGNARLRDGDVVVSRPIQSEALDLIPQLEVHLGNGATGKGGLIVS